MYDVHTCIIHYIYDITSLLMPAARDTHARIFIGGRHRKEQGTDLQGGGEDPRHPHWHLVGIYCVVTSLRGEGIL